MSASLTEYPDRKFTLKAQALRHADEEPTEAVTPSPFNLSGILVELIDVSETHKLVEMKSDLVTQVGYKLANNIESLLLATHLLQVDDLPTDERKLVANMIQNSSAEVSNVVRHACSLLTADVGTQQALRYPIDPIRILQRVRQELLPELEKSRLSFAFPLPNFQTLVIADPNQLASALSAIIKFLASDAVTGSSLTLRIDEEGPRLRFLFTNEGFGIPTERLQEYLETTDESDASGIFRRLRQARQTVAKWNGNLDLSSAVGGGTQAMLELNIFWEQPMNGILYDHQQIS
jgi:signal transduction histidine kinase